MPKKKKTKKLSFTKNRFNRIGLLATILIFGAIGVFMLVRSFAATGTIPIRSNAPPVAILSAGTNDKYWVAASDGGIFNLPTGANQSSAPFFGSWGNHPYPITAMAKRPTNDGYWLLQGNGAVGNFGKAGKYACTPGMTAQSDLTYYRALVSTPNGAGYWVISKLGQIFACGDAVDNDKTPSSGHNSINQDITIKNKAFGCCLSNLPAGGVVAAASTNTGRGLFLLSSDGIVNAYGDAVKWGDGIATAVGIAAYGAGSTGGYTLVTKAGNIYAYHTSNWGSPAQSKLALAKPISGIALTPYDKGYWLVAEDGGVFAYGDAHFVQAIQVTTHVCWDKKTYPLTTSCPAQPTTAKTTTSTVAPGSPAPSALVPSQATSLPAGSVGGTATPATCAKITLHPWDRGNCVTLLQNKLNALIGSKSGILSVDSNFGPNTVVAVCSYQKGNGLPVSSDVGAALWLDIAQGKAGYTACFSHKTDDKTKISLSACRTMVEGDKAAYGIWDYLENQTRQLDKYKVSAADASFSFDGAAHAWWSVISTDVGKMDDTSSRWHSPCTTSTMPTQKQYNEYYLALKDFKIQTTGWNEYLQNWVKYLNDHPGIILGL